MREKDLLELRRSEKYLNNTYQLIQPNVKNDVMIELQKYLNDDNIYISFTMDMSSVTQKSRAKDRNIKPEEVKKNAEDGDEESKRNLSYLNAVAPKSKNNVGYKIGLNPKKTFEGGTPLGIYCFPLKKSWEYYGIDQKGLIGFPDITRIDEKTFKPNIFILKPKVDVINILDLPKYCKMIVDLAKNKYGFTQEELSNRSNYVVPYDGTDQQIKSNIIWCLTEYMSSKRKKADDHDPVLWNKIFTEIGINALFDDGNGIIHVSEKVQAVFFLNLDLM